MQTLPIAVLPTVVLLCLLVVATVTDVRERRIYNWNTYPGILLGLALNYFVADLVGLQDGLIGFFACGFLMLFCLVFFDIGGGDVKLIAMMGAFLGLHAGIEALLWTFVLGGIFALVVLIWQVGFLRIVTKSATHIWLVVRTRSWVPPTEEERGPLKQGLYLAPSGLLAVGLVLWRRLLE